MDPVSSTVLPEVSSIASISFDEALPITAWHDEIAAAVAAHQVGVVAGETGSGKTTQLPKICLELGRRSIGHTQPRRIAARTVAEERIARRRAAVPVVSYPEELPVSQRRDDIAAALSRRAAPGRTGPPTAALPARSVPWDRCPARPSPRCHPTS